jgi:hypothetical protein
MLTVGHGIIVAEFFDSGESRVQPWARRPQAGALVAQLADPDRGWDAIVVGEYERAFYGSQYASMAPLFEHYGIQLWTPEVGGQVDWHAQDHEGTMLALGLSASAEKAGRLFLAAFPCSRWQGIRAGSRPSPPVAGHSNCSVLPIGADAFGGGPMTRDDIPSPAAYDPERNKHRCGVVWSYCGSLHPREPPPYRPAGVEQAAQIGVAHRRERRGARPCEQSGVE